MTIVRISEVANEMLTAAAAGKGWGLLAGEGFRLADGRWEYDVEDDVIAVLSNIAPPDISEAVIRLTQIRLATKGGEDVKKPS